MRRTLLSALLVVLVAAPAAGAARKPLLGIYGDTERFQALTGQESRVDQAFLGWNQGYRWGTPVGRMLPRLGDVPMLALKTGSGTLGSESITPLQIARGAGDEYLIALNGAIAASGTRIYVRPFPEMNGHWNPYCAYTKTGRLKGRSHSTRTFRKAFARVYVILHGGTAATMNRKLARLGLPGIRGDLPSNPFPRLRVIWNPQGYGSPNVPGNSAQAYYPGDAYVDVVGNDLYYIRGQAEWSANEALYRAHPTKPYAIPEWGLWGLDEPSFVRRMADFVRTHRRVELVSYYDSKRGSVWDLATKRRSRSAYRKLIAPLG